MKPKEIIDAARTLPFHSPRWDELYAAAAQHPHTEGLTDFVERMERRAYYKGEISNGCI